ncbi:MAG: ABC transporter ATP-binding protein [Chthoniobacterales bacterium]|nr:ABC transporter ATP-binding protein [Chthoniobacterales bacterium]
MWEHHTAHLLQWTGERFCSDLTDEPAFCRVLTVRDLTKHYGPLVALADVSFSLEPGEFFGLLGPNGAGKTTFMSLIAGLRAVDRGEILLHGKRFCPDRLEQRAQIGYVPQELALYVDLTAEENLRLFGQLYGLRGSLLRERVAEGLHAAQLEARRHDLVKTFSGGMRRRLNIVAAVLHRPQLLLCDEPTVGVDPQSRNAIFEFVEKLHAEGTTIVYSTHYMEEATRLCSRIGIIDHGKLLALGTLDELLEELPFTEQIRIARNDATAAQVGAFGEFGNVVATDETYVLRPRAGLHLSEFFAAMERLELPYRYFTVTRPTLENVFLHRTGKSLRDA